MARTVEERGSGAKGEAIPDRLSMTGDNTKMRRSTGTVSKA